VPSTAIVILNWNGKNYLERFLDILIERSSLPGAFVVVADNGSTDGSVEWLKENFNENVRVIEMGYNHGFTGGYNIALAMVEADYYILLNSDVEVCEGWLQPLVNSMENNKEVGICMPKIKSAFDKESFEYAGASGGFIDLLGYPFCRGRILSNIERDCAQYNSDLEIFWASGAAFMVRSSLFHSLGGFDNKFFAHMEEIDLCWRAKLQGWQVWVYPDSQVYHVGGGTLPNNSPGKLFLNYRNNLLMLYKNLPSGTLCLLLPVRIFLDWVSALLYLLQGQKPFFDSVVRAHKEFMVLRKEVARSPNRKSAKLSGIYKGSIVLTFFLSFKKLKFINIGQKIS
jgi:GT2 family glycosyltransferase